MRIQIVTFCAATLLLAACQRQPEQQTNTPAPAPTAAPETQPTGELQASGQIDPDDWAGVKYRIQSVPDEHGNVPHTSLDGTLEIVANGNEYTLKIEDGPQHKWPEEFKNAVLTFNLGERFCERPSPEPKVLTSADQERVADFIRGPKARRLTSKDVHKLHEESDHHTLHRIRICFVDPEQTGGKKEILISTDYEGGGHDGVSHGVS